MKRKKKISQVTARQLQKRVKELDEYQRNLYLPGRGVNVWNISGQSEKTQAVLNTARTLGFNLRARLNGETLELYAVK